MRIARVCEELLQRHSVTGLQRYSVVTDFNTREVSRTRAVVRVRARWGSRSRRVCHAAARPVVDDAPRGRGDGGGLISNWSTYENDRFHLNYHRQLNTLLTLIGRVWKLWC